MAEYPVSLCSDFRAVAEGETDVVIGIDRRMIQKRTPQVRAEFRDWRVQLSQRGNELLGRLSCGQHVRYAVDDLGDLCLDRRIAGGKLIELFLVFCLIEGDAGVFTDGLLHHLRTDIHLIQKAVLLSFERIGGVQLIECCIVSAAGSADAYHLIAACVQIHPSAHRSDASPFSFRRQ